MIDHKCIGCGQEQDPEEFSDPRDADVCGYCFTGAITSVRHKCRGTKMATTGFRAERLLCVMADVSMRLDDARRRGDKKAIEIYEQMQRLFDA